MKPESSTTPLTRGEKETQTAAERLNSQIEDALAAVALRSTSDTQELEACADRLERATRDLAVALRELAHERRTNVDNN
jgi:polyhydroxyalkanoate synthesis regulator phasin